ncbi:MAG: DUF3237 domain-containing protein [Actinomycetota bacterium]|nr:DUF3237 domain-containing protein [Actinomycetota bacterium]
MELVHEFTLHAALGESFRIGGGPYGSRGVGTVAGGSVKGQRISGELVGPGADWVVRGTDGYAQIDVRAQIRTDDGAILYLSYNGSLELNEVTTAALAGDGSTDFGDNDWFVHLRLEAGAEQYRWVNRTLFVGRGRVVADGVEYEVHRLA